MSFNLKNLISLVKVAVQNGASDIHIRTHEPPSFRIDGQLYPVQSKSLVVEDIIDLIRILTNKKSFKLDEIQDIDGSFDIKGSCRLRFNIFKYMTTQFGIICRIVKDEIPNLNKLKMPPILKEIALNKRGLNLVTGPTGSGKSTTLAAMIDYINKNRKMHIITIEDPIEFVHIQDQCRITQRELGQDVSSFSVALKSALRQDPDVILIGEMRDIETVSMCLKAAETGHAVFSTVHTNDVTSTIGRLIALFPPEEHDEVRKRLAFSLNSVVSQRLLPKIDKGMIPALEIMKTNPGIKDCILGKDQLSRIREIIEKGHIQRNIGSQSFDQHILELFKKNQISEEVALESVSSQANFTQKLNFE